MRRRRGMGPVCIIFFGIGLVMAFYFPIKILCVLLAVALIYLGVTYYRC